MCSNRGRLQAQHKGFDASESWSQSQPLKAADGRGKLSTLKISIPNEEAKKRQKAFSSAQKNINRIEKCGGIEVQYFKSFTVAGDRCGRRVDIEVRKGKAFTP